MWRQLKREGIEVARCTVRRLLRAMGLSGAVRGRAWVTTTHPDVTATRPPGLVDRQFTAAEPNQLWVSDFTYVATWRGFVYTALVIDVLARRIVGWQVSSSLRTDFVTDALEQAIYDRCGETPAAQMQRTFGFGMLACLRCGGRLRLIALIEEAAVIGQIIRHLDEPTEVPSPRRARAPPFYVGPPAEAAEAGCAADMSMSDCRS